MNISTLTRDEINCLAMIVTNHPSFYEVVSRAAEMALEGRGLHRREEITVEDDEGPADPRTVEAQAIIDAVAEHHEITGRQLCRVDCGGHQTPLTACVAVARMVAITVLMHVKLWSVAEIARLMGRSTAGVHQWNCTHRKRMIADAAYKAAVETAVAEISAKLEE